MPTQTNTELYDAIYKTLDAITSIIEPTPKTEVTHFTIDGVEQPFISSNLYETIFEIYNGCGADQKIDECPVVGDKCCNGDFILRFSPEETKQIRDLIEMVYQDATPFPYNGGVASINPSSLPQPVVTKLINKLPSSAEIEEAIFENEPKARIEYAVATLIDGLAEQFDEDESCKTFRKSQLVPDYMTEDQFFGFEI